MIYTITSVVNDITTDSRCWGYYSSLGEVDNYLKDDKFDIRECLYRYVVVEGFESGIPAGLPVYEQWYKEEEDKERGYGHKWIKCEKPERLNGVVNFGIG